MQKKRVLFVFSFLYIFIATVVAQKLTANAPQQVAVGQQFRLSYTVNTQDVSGFRVGQIPDAFEVLMGPSQSSQSSFQIILVPFVLSASAGSCAEDSRCNLYHMLEVHL